MSGKLSTNNLQGGGIPKLIQPGNPKAKVHSIFLEPFPFKENAYHVVMLLETPPIGNGYEGFMINKDSPDLGNYEGQIARVKSDEYAFADGKTKTGRDVSRDKSILIFLRNLCEAMGVEEWFKQQNEKHDTIEDFVKAMDNDKPFGNKYFDWCLAGKEYESKGYKNYDLFLPKFTKEAAPVQVEGANPSKLIKFDRSQHIKKSKKADEVANFTANPTGPESLGPVNTEFNLD